MGLYWRGTKARKGDGEWALAAKKRGSMKAVALIREVEVGGTRGSEVGLGSGNSRAQEVRDAFRIMEHNIIYI